LKNRLHSTTEGIGTEKKDRKIGNKKKKAPSSMVELSHLRNYFIRKREKVPLGYEAGGERNLRASVDREKGENRR